MQRIVNVVRVVREAKKRKPSTYKTQSFFGAYDFWQFVPEFDDRRCPDCTALWDIQYFKGTDLRTTFQYMVIQDDDTIRAEVHPHCRCYLFRVTVGKQYDKIYTLLYGD